MTNVEVIDNVWSNETQTWVPAIQSYDPVLDAFVVAAKDVNKQGRDATVKPEDNPEIEWGDIEAADAVKKPTVDLTAHYKKTYEPEPLPEHQYVKLMLNYSKSKNDAGGFECIILDKDARDAMTSVMNNEPFKVASSQGIFFFSKGEIVSGSVRPIPIGYAHSKPADPFKALRERETEEKRRRSSMSGGYGYGYGYRR